MIFILRFMIVSADLLIDIAIFHGTDKAKQGNKVGHGIADFNGERPTTSEKTCFASES
jgi:hypothetical protein